MRSGTYDALLHWKALLVIAACDAEDLERSLSVLLSIKDLVVSYIALPFITKTVGRHFIAHSLVHEDTQFPLIVNVEKFLRPIGWERDVELHLNGS